MAGRHDRAGDDAGLLRTGPIVVRGLSRGVKDAVRTSRRSRHRAATDDVVSDEVLEEDEIPLEGDETIPMGQDQGPEADPTPSVEQADEQEDPTVVARGRDDEPEQEPIDEVEQERSEVDSGLTAAPVEAASTPGDRSEPGSGAGVGADGGSTSGSDEEPEPEPVGGVEDEPEIEQGRAGVPGVAGDAPVGQGHDLSPEDGAGLDTSADAEPEARGAAAAEPEAAAEPGSTPSADQVPDDGVSAPREQEQERLPTSGFEGVAVERSAVDHRGPDEVEVGDDRDDLDRLLDGASAGPVDEDVREPVAAPSPAARVARVARNVVPVDGRPWRDRLNQVTVGVAVLVVLGLVCAGLIVAVMLKTRSDAETAAREAAAYTPPPLASSAPGGDRPVIAVVADDSADESASGVPAAQRWPQLLGAALDGDVVVVSGAGYTAESENGDTFVDAAAGIPADAAVVLFVGGAGDASASSLSLARQATRAFAAAKERAPDAEVAAVGPFYIPSTGSSADLAAVRTALQSAARIAGVRWVDPVRASWLSDVDDVSDLDAAAERRIASRLEKVVGDELD